MVLNTATKNVGLCKVCGDNTLLYDVVDELKMCSSSDFYTFGLSGRPVYYQRCKSCSFIFTTYFDDWTAEQFSARIYNEDYHLVDGNYQVVRPRETAGRFARAFPDFLDRRILDYGSGSGLFAQTLRGMDALCIENFDPFSSPSRPDDLFDVITCFEVMEHSPQPRKTIEDILTFAAPNAVIVFTTGLQPPDIDQSRANWWYIAPRNGHVSIFSEEALIELARDFGMELFHSEGFLLFSKKQVQPHHSATFALVVNCRAPTQLDASWHATQAEAEQGVRWTSQREIAFSVGEMRVPAQVTVKVPYVAETEPGLAERCQIAIGHQLLAPKIVRQSGKKTLYAKARITSPIEHVRLLMPEPLDGGSEMRKRPSGLLIPVA